MFSEGGFFGLNFQLKKKKFAGNTYKMTKVVTYYLKRCNKYIGVYVYSFKE